MFARIVPLILLTVAACDFTPAATPELDDAAPVLVVDAHLASSIDARPTTTLDAATIDARPTVAPGGACACDADCHGEGPNAGVCVYGVCMTRATGACPSDGAHEGCPAGSRCWPLDGSNLGGLCWPDFTAHACSGTCDSDGSCSPTGDCDPTCGSACSCTASSCPPNQTCGTDGTCG
jgi:hypothetical protein